MFSGPAFTPNSGLNNPFNQKQPGVCCYFIILTSYETNLKPTHGNGNMSSFVPLKLTSKVTQVSLNVSLVAFWALLMDHGVWFFDSWASGDCCERRSKRRDSTTKSTDSTIKLKGRIQQPQPKKKDSTTNRFSFLVVESDLDCKLRIIMRIQ